MMNLRGMGIWPAAGLLWLAVIACGVGGVVRGAEDVRPRRSVELEPSVLQAYVGQYELAPKALLTLRREGAYLTAQITGQPAIVVYAENETTFFWKVVDAHFTIEKDADGKVDGVRFEQGAAKIKAKKVSSELPKAEELPEIEEPMDGPRLGALAKELKKGNRDDVLKAFWNDAQNKGPIIEPVAGDKQSSWVSFLWHGDAHTRRVSMTGGLPTPDDTKWLTRLGDTDLWYRTERIPNDARFAYWFQPNRPLKMPGADNPQRFAKVMELCPSRPDPLNPRMTSLQGMLLASVLELPAAPPQPWVKRRPGVPQGALKDRTIKSGSLKQERTVTIYTPANYDPAGEACGLLVLFDGDWYQDGESIPGPVILDNLIAAKQVKPLVAVFVKQPLQTRNADLGCSQPLAAFVAKELIPLVEKEYHVSPDPKHRIIGGMSLGGLMASYCGLHHPEVFGNVLSQSGSYQWYPGFLERDESVPPDAEPGALMREFVASPRRDLRFYLEAGRFEDGGFASLYAGNLRFRDVLLAKGYPVTWSPFTGGHDMLSWRGSFADALIALAKP